MINETMRGTTEEVGPRASYLTIAHRDCLSWLHRLNRLEGVL